MGCAERRASVFPYLRRIAVIYLADWIKAVKFAALKHPENDKARDDTSIIWRLRNDAGHVGFEDHPSHANAARYFRFNGGSAVLNVELEGDVDTTARFVESLQLAAHMTMIGDSITVVTHPASTTHKQLSEADMIKAGVTPTLLRISLGLEDVEDIIADFEQAFAKLRKNN